MSWKVSLDRWFNELFRRGIGIKETALIIERTFKLFC